MTIIAFVGSVFSPYYAWSGRRDPLDHCAINVALYGPRGKRWTMTERGRAAVWRETDTLAIGPSALRWDGAALNVAIDEVCVPFPSKIRGNVRIEPTGLNTHIFPLDANGRHIWRPIAPTARVIVDLDAPDLAWRGEGYFDMNAGAEPLEDGFTSWTWSRGGVSRGAAILYDTIGRDGEKRSLAMRFDRTGRSEPMPPPVLTALPGTRWRVARETRSDDGFASVTRCFEDTPFYARSLISAALFGERVVSVHESLSLKRFASPVVRLMLPFRMPRTSRGLPS